MSSDRHSVSNNAWQQQSPVSDRNASSIFGVPTTMTYAMQRILVLAAATALHIHSQILGFGLHSLRTTDLAYSTACSSDNVLTLLTPLSLLSPFTTMTVYKSPYPDIVVPKHSVFTHLFGPSDPFPPSSIALIDGITDERITRAQLKASALTFAWGIRNRLGELGSSNLKRGDTALIFSSNSILYPVVSLGLVNYMVRLTVISS